MILPDNDETRTRAAQVVAAGGVIGFRTDTFYGLGADPFNCEAVAAVRRLKGRDGKNPILVIVSDLVDVDRFIETRSPAFDFAIGRYWPGPLTIVGVAISNLSEELTSTTGTIGVRLPADDEVRDLVRCCGGALTATSANPSRNPPARSAQEVDAYFTSAIDLVIDSGQVTALEPSTVLDLSAMEPRLIREGAIRRKELEAIFGKR